MHTLKEILTEPQTMYDGGIVQHMAEGGQPENEDEGIMSLSTAGDIAYNLVSFLPGIGDAIDIKEAYQALTKEDGPDYTAAGVAALGLIPYVGDIAQAGIRGAKATSKAIDKASTTKKVTLENNKAADEIGESLQISEQGLQTVSPPKKSVKAYKLFRKKPNSDELFPLFVDATSGIPKNKWIGARAGEMSSSGKVKSKIGNLSFRPGWHAGDYISSKHIGGKSSKGLTKPDYRPADQVWAEVEMSNDVDWQSIANSRASTIKSGKNKGKLNAKEAQIKDQVPTGGFYKYKTNPNMKGNWLISGEMKVNKLLTPKEIQTIQTKTNNFDFPTLPEVINQKKLSIEDLTDKAITELKIFYPEVYKKMSKPMYDGGIVNMQDGGKLPVPKQQPLSKLLRTAVELGAKRHPVGMIARAVYRMIPRNKVKDVVRFLKDTPAHELIGLEQSGSQYLQKFVDDFTEGLQTQDFFAKQEEELQLKDPRRTIRTELPKSKLMYDGGLV